MARETHTDRVYKHLMEYGTITSMEAFERYGITRLSAAIFILRKRFKEEGKYYIASVDKEVINRYGYKVHFAEYTIGEYAND